MISTQMISTQMISTQMISTQMISTLKIRVLMVSLLTKPAGKSKTLPEISKMNMDFSRKNKSKPVRGFLFFKLRHEFWSIHKFLKTKENKQKKNPKDFSEGLVNF